MADDSWFAWTILSAVCFGIYSFFYKMAIEEEVDALTLQVVMPSTVIILSVSFLFLTSSFIGDDLKFIFGVALLQGILFYLTTITRIKAFEHKVPPHIVFPIIKSSTIFIVIVSSFVFNEFDNLTEPKRTAGILIAILSTYLLLPTNRSLSKVSRIGVVFAIAAMFSSAGVAIASKYLFLISESKYTEVNIFGFMLLSNLVTLFFSSGTVLFSTAKKQTHSISYNMSWGVAMGVLNFIGFASFLQAVKYGDLSLVAAISALYILIPIILSAVIYREHLSLINRLAVLLSIIAIVLIK